MDVWITTYNYTFLYTKFLYKYIYLLSICMGIFFDEIGFILIKGKNHEDNYSPKSFMILIFFIILLFIFRKPIVNFYLNTNL